jgi:hypothetical protein
MTVLKQARHELTSHRIQILLAKYVAHLSQPFCTEMSLLQSSKELMEHVNSMAIL